MEATERLRLTMRMNPFPATILMVSLSLCWAAAGLLSPVKSLVNPAVASPPIRGQCLVRWCKF